MRTHVTLTRPEATTTTRVRDAMTRPVVTLDPGASLRDAADALCDYGVSSAPVCDARGALLGVVSKADLLDGVFDRCRDAATRVGDVMSRFVVTASPDEPLDALARRMVFEGAQRAVVVERSGELVGIVTALDVLRATVGTHGSPRLR